jgi:hypothetical protein
MTGTAAAETGATDQTSEQTSDAEQSTDEGAKPEVDWKAKAREWEKRAKANADAATRLTQIEESQKSETQKLADAKTAAEKAAAEAQADALRWRIAAKHQISDEDAELFLTGIDEETLTKQAKRLTERDSDRKKQGNHAPKEGANTTAAPNDERAFARELFGSSG